MTPFWMAVSMFTVLPAPFVWDENRKQEMLLCFPFTGLLIGTLWAVAAWLLSKTPFSFLSAALMAVFPWMLSGFIHLDGYADCADAYLSRADQEKKLRILKDSRIGAFALIATVLLVLFSFAAFLEIACEKVMLIFLFIPFVSRASAAAAVLNIPAMHGSSYEGLQKDGVKKAYRILPFIFMLAALPVAFLICGCAAGALALEIAVSWTVIFRLRSDFGGMNGDISGCSIVLSELAAVIGTAMIGGIGL